MDKKETPVLLLTGYLGSGKTTLVNKILSNNKGIKFAVIVNDIGEVNIDADLIEKGGVVDQQDDSLVALQNGCICCTLKMDLVQQLSDIVKMHRFDYIVIEASGICEPAPIAQTICAYPQIYPDLAKDGRAVLDSIVTVVDARRMCDEFSAGNDLMKKELDEDDIENLLIQQIEFCSFVLLNKADDVSPEELQKVRTIVRALQPKAEIIECNYGNVDFDRILDTKDFDFDKVATSASWIAAIENEGDDEHHEHDEHHHDEHHGEKHSHHHHHHHHHDHLENEEHGEALEYNIDTFVYYARRPFDLNFFDDFVARKWPKSIIRCKGLCYFDNEKDICYVFEQAGKQVTLRNAGQWYATMPEFELREFLERNPRLKKDWEEPYGDRMQKLVFIGQNMDKAAIKAELDKCLK
ncbi:CobW family GTP-binding protein [Prevotella intermedia]|uniref:Cobalamin biosynthesis protein CobW n=1 Tax=Prevotella intermedia TaxID=28131 RepID=A0A2A6EEE2_PREIN|nr:GTP-binding protein [Prevotella intermedia]ATV27449.1 GTP-binding protein [Prevotella intermedia]MCK6143781.1 GTP-binding protein [Prevotella intermedia]PDP60064.1 cobalamin biosynthesis protein CobW [Prevotella intermedia]PJI26005.1 GTP-binding protein [Prevotella intermedia]